MHNFFTSSYWDKLKLCMILFEKLYVSVQALDTMTKLVEIHEYVKITLDKLLGIGLI